MFKLLLYTTLLSVTVSVSCYAQTLPMESKPHYDQSEIDRLLKKSRNQKITAWSMLGGGTILALIGISSAAVGGLSDVLGGVVPQKNTTADILFYTGLISMVGSIPLFIVSGNNKKKANAMVGTTYYPNPATPTHLKSMPSAGIQITIR